MALHSGSFQHRSWDSGFYFLFQFCVRFSVIVRFLQNASFEIGSSTLPPPPLSDAPLGLCVDLRASARRDWLSGCSVARGCGAGRSSWVPVATLAADEAAVCSSTGRSVAHGCGLGCSWEWQAAALRLGRRFGHHGCGG
jgi:hypothetical protein